MKFDRMLFLAVPTFLVLGACAAETDGDEEQGDSANDDVRVHVEDGATDVKPKMVWWCEPHTSTTVEDCRSGTCQPAEITCDECSWFSLTFRGGCYYYGN